MELRSEPADVVRPVFIVGVGRSGTTLAVNLVGSHPLLSPVYETAFVKNLLSLGEWAAWFCGDSLSRRSSRILLDRPTRALFKRRCAKYRAKCDEFRNRVRSLPDFEELRRRGVRQKYEWFPYKDPCIFFDLDVMMAKTDALITSLLETPPPTSGEVYVLIRRYLEELFTLHCQTMNKPFWVNKTPRLLLCLEQLQKVFPGAKCVHIVRDGRDVAVSNLSLAWGPSDVRGAARRWKRSLARRKNFDPGALDYFEVHYEDLIRFPQAVLRRLFEFLGLEAAPVDEILGHFKIYDERIGAWRKAFSQRDREIFAEECGELLIELGYENDDGWVRV